MPKYLISWTEEDWYNLTVDAPSKKAALDMFFERRYNVEDVIFVGSELQDSIEVEQI